ncbi:hypothetical protein FRB93_000416 [Tulasnella sp. JGI-2019a]|nr:hypothetical protein FRB93_000416 [Tulasnella sp. JGI-2019a]
MSNNDTDSACLSVLSTGEIVGLSFIAQSGVISTVAVLIFAALVVRNVIYNRLHPGPHGQTLPLIRTHVDGYMLSLLFADLLQGIGAFLSAKWAANGRVTCSTYCSAQGIIQQLGETGVALNTLVITLHTFATVFLRWQPSRRPRLWMFVVALIWTYLGLFVLLGYVLHTGARKVGGAPYYGPTPYWCWIGPNYLWERIFGEYFWLWFCALINFIAYPFLFFTLRGNIEVDPSNWKRIRFRRRGQEGIFGQINSSDSRGPHPMPKRDEENMRILKTRNKEAMKMFWYPLSYTILVLPLSVTRWSTFRSRTDFDTPVKDMSIVTTSAVLFVFGLSGLVNVLLFLFTRPNLLLFNLRRDDRRLKKLQIISGGSFPRAQTNRNHSQTGLHRRRTREEDWDPDEDIMNEEYDRASNSQFQLSAYPPPPSELAPPPPRSPRDSQEENVEKTFSERYGSRALSAQSVSSASLSQYRGNPQGTAADGQVTAMRSTSSLGQVMADGSRSFSPGSFGAHGVSRMPSIPALSEEYQPPLTYGLDPSSLPRTPRSPHGASGFQQSHYATPSRIREDAEEDASSPIAARGVDWVPVDEYPGTSPLPPPPSQPPTPMGSVYSRSSRQPPPPTRASPHDPVFPISPPPQGYPSQMTSKDKVEEWALRSAQDRTNHSTSVPDTGRPPA